jgi:hypothetical protein
MKNLRQDLNDSLRPEYRRSDLDGVVQGRYAKTQLQFAELVHLFLTCIGEDNDITFSHHSVSNNRAGHKRGDWTYELDNANQITLRYWLAEFENIEEHISNPPCVMSSEERIELQHLLVTHVQRLKTRVERF